MFARLFFVFALGLGSGCAPESIAGPPGVDAAERARNRVDESLEFLAIQRAIPMFGTFTAGASCVAEADVPQELVAEGAARWAEPMVVLDVNASWIADGAPTIPERSIIARLEHGALLADGAPAFVEPSEGFLFLARLAPFPEELPAIRCDGVPYEGGGYVPYTFFHRERYEPGYSVDEMKTKAQAGYEQFNYETVELDWTYLTVRVDEPGPT